MSRRLRRTLAACAGFVLTVVAVSAAVRVWRQERDKPASDDRAPDPVVADRVRSALGSVEKALDVPRVHVQVERGVALLHGDVPTEAAAQVLVERAAAVPGVRAVASHLHVGMLPSDTAPSSGHVERSAVARRLIAAARGGGGGEVTAELAARRVVEVFASALPRHARTRVASHLPLDVAPWALPERPVPGLMTVDDLYDAVVADDLIPAAHAPWVVVGVLRALRASLPSDVGEIGRELPGALRHLWADAVPTA